MIFDQQRLLRLIAPRLSAALISPESLDALDRFAGGLPCAFSWGLIELRLAPDDARADLSVAALSWEGSREALVAALADDRGAPLGALRPLLGAWGAGEGWLADMPYLGLEWDEPGAGGRAPFVFLAIDPEAYGRWGCHRPLDQTIELAREGLTWATGTLDPVSFATWERCVRGLPTGGRAVTTAPLASRGQRELRLDAMLPYPAIPGWLDTIGWPGDRRRLGHLLELIGRGGRRNLQLDLGAEVGTMLGILYRPGDAERAPRSWCRMFDQVCALGACAPAKAEAALAWLGTETIDLPDLRWPIAVQRDLDLKLTLRPDDRLEVKCYLSYHAAWGTL